MQLCVSFQLLPETDSLIVVKREEESGVNDEEPQLEEWHSDPLPLCLGLNAIIVHLLLDEFADISNCVRHPDADLLPHLLLLHR